MTNAAGCAANTPRLVSTVLKRWIIAAGLALIRVGMPKGAEIARGGLGTSIITALAAQLRARIEVTDTNPGTSISIIHTEREAHGLNRPAV